jgi:hypothetical protein
MRVKTDLSSWSYIHFLSRWKRNEKICPGILYKTGRPTVLTRPDRVAAISVAPELRNVKIRVHHSGWLLNRTWLLTANVTYFSGPLTTYVGGLRPSYCPRGPSCRMSRSSSAQAEARARKLKVGGLPTLELSRGPDCGCLKAALPVIISNDRFSDVQIRRLGKLPLS